MNQVVRPKAAVFRLLELLGEGHSSQVFKAVREDAGQNSRHVIALKVLKSRKLIQKLRREFETLVEVQSPYCVRVLGWEELPQGPSLVLEYILGLSLLDLMVEPLGPMLTEEVCFQIQEGLKHLAAKGLCHGDLSPANILIDVEGQVRLVDFGLTGEGGVVEGTPRYMAPERWTGHPFDIRGDLFSLGQVRKDLIEGFRPEFENPVGTKSFWRRRADQSAVAGDPLLDPCARRREFLVLRGSTGSRRELGRRVRETLEAKKVEGTRTVRMDRPAISKEKSVSLAWVASFVMLFLASSAPKVEGRTTKASLRVRTLRWVDVSLDGAPMGFSPIYRDGILPGRHILKWKTALASGELEVELKANERKDLFDEHFQN